MTGDDRYNKLRIGIRLVAEAEGVWCDWLNAREGGPDEHTPHYKAVDTATDKLREAINAVHKARQLEDQAEAT